jgi:hypothetical protein
MTLNNKMLLHYQLVDAFRKKYFQNLLTEEHLVEGEKFFKKYLDMEGDEVEFNKFVIILQKEGIKYLAPSSCKNTLPIRVDSTEKVSIGGEAYLKIDRYSPAKFTPEKKMNMKELVDTLASFEHSQPDQYKVDVMTALTQILTKAFFRKSSSPSFGKDSTIATLGSLSYKALTIENPTIAKLEMLSSTKLLAINELNDISKADWKMIEQFLLAVGAFKETYTKRSRATSGVGEIIDISKLSVAIMYNDVDCYEDPERYFDYRATKQCKDRFPALRYYGCFTEDFNAVDKLNIEEFVDKHWDTYVGIIRTLAYYSIPSNVLKELKHYKCSELSRSNRWNNSLNKLLRIVDLYSSSQEEFDKYVLVVKQCLAEYESMVRYPELVQRLAIHLKITKDDRKGINRLQDLLYFLQTNTTEKDKSSDSHKAIVSTIQNYISQDSFIVVEQLIKGLIGKFEKDNSVKKQLVADLNSKHW